jgi:hypothetical protein
VAGLGGEGLLCLSCGAHEHARPLEFPLPRPRPLATRTAPAQPTGSHDLEEHGSAGRSLAAYAPDIPPVAISALPRQTPKVGAVCGKAARTVLCGGRSVMSVPTAIQKALPLLPARMREHQDLWGAHAAAASPAPLPLSLASPGYQRSNNGRSVPSRARVRVCSRRWAPRLVHCIC